MNKWQNLPSVMVSGAVGGLLAWLIAASSTGSIGSHWPIDLPMGILGGAIAAGAGVFLLANTDPTQLPKMVVFAAICGLSWQGIIATAKNLVNEATTHKDVAQARENINKDLAKTQPSVPEIQSLASNTTKVAEKLPSVTDPELRKEAVQTATKAVNKLEMVAFEKPEAVSALEEIGKGAAASGSATLKAAVKESLQAISSSDQAPPETRRRAAKAVDALSKSP